MTVLSAETALLNLLFNGRIQCFRVTWAEGKLWYYFNLIGPGVLEKKDGDTHLDRQTKN